MRFKNFLIKKNFFYFSNFLFSKVFINFSKFFNLKKVFLLKFKIQNLDQNSSLFGPYPRRNFGRKYGPFRSSMKSENFWRNWKWIEKFFLLRWSVPVCFNISILPTLKKIGNITIRALPLFIIWKTLKFPFLCFTAYWVRG